VPSTEHRYTYLAKGKYWRFRHPLTGDVALPIAKGVLVYDQPKQAAWLARYAELLAAVERRQNVKPVSTKSFAWLIEQYRGSAEFAALADETQRSYNTTLNHLKVELGEVQFALATKAMLKAVRDDHQATARKAHKIKQMLSRLYSWAEEEGHVGEGFNPASSIKRLKRKGGDREIVVWSDEEIELFLKTCPAHVLTPVLIALYTGQRREDVAKMEWTQFQGNIVRVRQSKTTALLDIACHSLLRKHLDALPRTGAVICTTAAATPFSVHGLSQALRRAVTSTPAMPQNRSMHGLRYAAGSRMEEAGCSVAEIESVLGHQTFKMALKYASQRLRAKAALEKLEEKDAA
jgi:integrase